MSLAVAVRGATLPLALVAMAAWQAIFAVLVMLSIGPAPAALMQTRSSVEAEERVAAEQLAKQLELLEP